jgi:type I restriction enzyme S subunit
VGGDIDQKYKKVEEKYLAYNPHRVNVGSIGVVDEETSGGYVSGIYFVFKSINEKIPPEYILHLLKSIPYKKVIAAYDTKYGAVRANLTYSQLCRIKIPILPQSVLKKFFVKQNILRKVTKEMNKEKESMTKFIYEITTKDLNPNHKEDFEEVLKLATSNEPK